MKVNWPDLITAAAGSLAGLAALSPTDQGLIASLFPAQYHQPVIAFFVIVGIVSHSYGAIKPSPQAAQNAADIAKLQNSVTLAPPQPPAK